MQYEITLPGDYDMTAVRHRVETRGHLLDGAPGLALKAYLIRERGRAGSPVNQYAPYYLWDDPQALTGFLRGPGFHGLSGDFGRPAVRTWHGLAHLDGPARGTEPRAAERLVSPVPEGVDLGAHLEEAVDALAVPAGADGVHTAALGLDPHRWELVRFVLRDAAVPGAEGERYEVLHLSPGPGR